MHPDVAKQHTQVHARIDQRLRAARARAHQGGAGRHKAVLRVTRIDRRDQIELGGRRNQIVGTRVPALQAVARGAQRGGQGARAHGVVVGVAARQRGAVRVGRAREDVITRATAGHAGAGDDRAIGHAHFRIAQQAAQRLAAVQAAEAQQHRVDIVQNAAQTHLLQAVFGEAQAHIPAVQRQHMRAALGQLRPRQRVLTAPRDLKGGWAGGVRILLGGGGDQAGDQRIERGVEGAKPTVNLAQHAREVHAGARAQPLQVGHIDAGGEVDIAGIQKAKWHGSLSFRPSGRGSNDDERPTNGPRQNCSEYAWCAPP